MLILFALLQAPPVQQFPRVDAPGGHVHGLRQVVDQVCNNPTTLDRTGLLAREDKLATDAHDAHAPAATWIALGCARAALAGDGAIARPGLLMVAGNSWSTGAERALLEGLKLDPGNARAAEVLGDLALDDLQPDNLREEAAAIVKGVGAGATTPGVLRACGEFALRVKDNATSRRCATMGLSRGSDSTWHLLRLARVAFRETDTAGGSRYYLAAMAAAHDSAARDEVEWHLQWFLSPTEQVAFTTVADSARSTWVRDRLAERDVRDGQRPGARLAEHFNRLEYVLDNFRLDLSRIARKGGGMIGTEPLNHWPPDSVRDFCEPGLVPALPVRDYSRWQDRIDDRGVVWLRFGPPEKRIRATPTCDSTIWDYDPTGHRSMILATNVREVWRYDIDGRPLILNFEAEQRSGSVEATRLVTGVLGTYLCDVDARRCTLTELAKAAWTANHMKNGAQLQTEMVHPEEIEQIREEDRGFISDATTKDDNSPRGDRNIPLASQLSRLWDPLSGAPISLVTYAVPQKDLSIQENAGKRTTLMDMELREWDPVHGAWRDTVFSRHLNVPDTSLKRPTLVGFVVVPSAPTVSAWSLVVTQPDQRRGRRYDVGTPGLGNDPLALSDIVLGSEADGVVWSLHNVEIPLAPTGVLNRKTPVALYYQLRSAMPRPDLRTTIALFRSENGVAGDTAALQVGFDQGASTGINEVAPALDVSRLDAGSYWLEVRITDPNGAVLARRRVPLELE